MSKSINVCLLFLSFLCLVPAAQGQPCNDAWPATLNSTDRAPAAGSVLWRLDVTEPGLLAVEASGDRPNATARIHLLDASCERLDRPVFTERSASHAALVVRPGTYFVRVGTEDPRQAFDAVRLTSAFVGVSCGPGTKDEDHEVDPDPKLWTKDEDHEVDPDPKDEDHEVDPDPKDVVCGLGTKDEDHEVDPDPEAKAAARALLADACADGDDTFFCASPMTEAVVEGTLANGWGDDEDVYTFELSEMRTVTLAVEGAGLLLHDRFGLRLGKAFGRDAEGGRLVRTLPAGSYSVRVRARTPGIDGTAYTLEMASSAW